jgi:phosphoribosylformimino-5-aminoimidazole carboxamide ribotide isomerase
MLIIPAIDLRDGHCVRLRQGRKDDMTRYDGNPVEVAKDFASQGAEWLHVVDLDGAFTESDSPNRHTLESIVAAVKIPVQFGGGLRSIEDVAQVLGLGVARVVIGTLAVESPDTLRKLLALHGSDQIAVGIDARNGLVMTRGWERPASIESIALARQVASAGVRRVIYTDISRDGVLAGPNIKETCDLARESGLKVTASGGVASLQDIEELKQAEPCGVDSVIVGRAIYERRFTLAEAIRVAEN